jgi:hypothetical protein
VLLHPNEWGRPIHHAKKQRDDRRQIRPHFLSLPFVSAAVDSFTALVFLQLTKFIYAGNRDGFERKMMMMIAPANKQNLDTKILLVYRTKYASATAKP